MTKADLAEAVRQRLDGYSKREAAEFERFLQQHRSIDGELWK